MQLFPIKERLVDRSHQSCKMAGVSEDPDDIMSLQEVLDEDKELVDTANAVLGDGDDSQCSYSKVNHLLITSN